MFLEHIFYDFYLILRFQLCLVVFAEKILNLCVLVFFNDFEALMYKKKVNSSECVYSIKTCLFLIL
jgi:hypothetical protein